MNEKQTPAAPAQPGPATVRPTKKQKELLGYIEQFIQQNGYSPSYREIMRGLNYTSVATVALHVKSLIQRGHVRKRDHSARSLEVVNPTLTNEVKLLTNEVKESEEKWLIAKLERLFVEAESEALPTTQQISDIQTLFAAFEVLGIQAATKTQRSRLNDLMRKLDT